MPVDSWKLGLPDLVQNNEGRASIWSSDTSEITLQRAWLWIKIIRDPSIEPQGFNAYRLNKDKEATRQIWQQPVSQKSRVEWFVGNQAALIFQKEGSD